MHKYGHKHPSEYLNLALETLLIIHIQALVWTKLNTSSPSFTLLLKMIIFICIQLVYTIVMGKTTINNIPENAADIISPNLQESMRSNNQRAVIINHQKHK